MMEYWNDAKEKKTKILLNPIFHCSNIPLFQLRNEVELSSPKSGAHHFAEHLRQPMLDYRAPPTTEVLISQLILVFPRKTGLVKIKEKYPVITVHQYIARMQIDMKDIIVDKSGDLIDELFHRNLSMFLICTTEFSKSLFLFNLSGYQPPFIKQAALEGVGNRFRGAYTEVPYFLQ